MAGKTHVEDCLLQDKNNVKGRHDGSRFISIAAEQTFNCVMWQWKMAFAVQGRRCKCYIM